MCGDSHSRWTSTVRHLQVGHKVNKEQAVAIRYFTADHMDMAHKQLSKECYRIATEIEEEQKKKKELPKKINEDLDYLKKSIDIVRETPQYMANELLARALQKVKTYQFTEVRHFY